MGERFNWSSYQIALGINALMTGLGLTEYLVTQGKVIRMKIIFGREKIAAHKLRGPMLGYQVDAKEVIEALPNCKSHKTNMLTMNRLPEQDYEEHWAADGDSGEVVAEGVIKVIDDTNSKDSALVGASDGAPNNTSEDTGNLLIPSTILLKNNFHKTYFYLISRNILFHLQGSTLELNTIVGVLFSDVSVISTQEVIYVKNYLLYYEAKLM